MKAKSYKIAIADQYANFAYIESIQIWVTRHGLLTGRGMADVYGPQWQDAKSSATICDHLRFNQNGELIIVDEIGREGLNLAVHPFVMPCLLTSWWRFEADASAMMLPVYGDMHLLVGSVERLVEAVCNRDGQPYTKPSNMFGNAVELDH